MMTYHYLLASIGGAMILISVIIDINKNRIGYMKMITDLLLILGTYSFILALLYYVIVLLPMSDENLERAQEMADRGEIYSAIEYMNNNVPYNTKNKRMVAEDIRDQLIEQFENKQLSDKESEEFYYYLEILDDMTE